METVFDDTDSRKSMTITYLEELWVVALPLFLQEALREEGI